MIPRFPGREPGGGLGIGWKAGKLDPEAGRRLAAAIAGALA